MQPGQLRPTLINTQKIDNGDGSYTINETYQFVNTRVIKLSDLDAQLIAIQAQKDGLPVGAIPKGA